MLAAGRRPDAIASAAAAVAGSKSDQTPSSAHHAAHLHRVQQPFIIGATADVVGSIREACDQAGMDHVLTKPVRLMEVRHVCQHWGGMALQQERDLLQQQRVMLQQDESPLFEP